MLLYNLFKLQKVLIQLRVSAFCNLKVGNSLSPGLFPLVKDYLFSAEIFGGIYQLFNG